MNDHLFGKELFIRFTVGYFANVYEFVCASFHFGFEGGMWDLNVVISDHCISAYYWLFY